MPARLEDAVSLHAEARAFARSSGLSVSALTAEKTTATATVIATADKLSSGSAHESHRHKHGAENERDHDDRPLSLSPHVD